MLERIMCDCSITDLCPQNKVGSEKRCMILVNKKTPLPDLKIINNSRDRLWCLSLTYTLDMLTMNRVLQNMIGRVSRLSQDKDDNNVG